MSTPYDMHGSRTAIRIHIEHGVFEFTGGSVAPSYIIHSAERVTETIEAVTTDLLNLHTPLSVE